MGCFGRGLLELEEMLFSVAIYLAVAIRKISTDVKNLVKILLDGNGCTRMMKTAKQHV